jgi:lysophospholipase L1-like esterase
LSCASGVAVTLDEAALLGEHTDDLLVDDGNDLNNVFAMIGVQPQLITLSMIGNDMLDVDPGDGGTQADVNRAVSEVLDARQNLQEALSAMVSEVPGADILLNTLYDNEASDCDPSNFHQSWIPIVDRILRDLAWGQTRRISIVEVAADFAQFDQAPQCTGFTGMICLFFLDLIHPNEDGYEIIGEKIWEAAGGVNLGAQDVLLRASHADVDYGYLRRVRRILPTAWEVRDGASVVNPEAALSDLDAGSPASITLGNGSEEFRVFGFPNWFDEIQIVRVIAGVRYRTAGAGAAVDDVYRMEAAVTSVFRPPPGFAYSPTNWNFYTPIVGGGGPSQPPENPDYANAETLVVPNVASYREVSATLTKNPTLPGGAADYEWPALTHEDLATTTIRVAAAPEPGAAGDDDYHVELDYAWLDLYGWEKQRPPEVLNLRVGRTPDGTLDVSFDALAGAQRYNLYSGRILAVGAGDYDHGRVAPAGPFCDASTQAAGAGRLAVTLAVANQPVDDAYFLVTAHVDDVESPAGASSEGQEIDRSQSICQ